MDKKLFSVAAAYESMYQVAEEVKYPHMMYDPKTGKEVEAKTPADHAKFAKMGYTHEKPKMDEAKADEGNAFTKALMAAREKGDKTFTVAGKEYKCEDYDEDGKLIEKSMDPVDPKAAAKKFKDRKDKDIDNDGDVDSSDEYLHNRRKAIGKSMKKEEVELTEREDTAMQVARALKKMGVKSNAKEAEVIKKIPSILDKMKLTPGAKRLILRDPDFLGDVFDSLSDMKKEDTDIRERLMSVWEDAAGTKRMKDQNREPMNKADADQKMYDAHQNPEKHGEIGKEADDSSKAERSGPGGKSARTNDAKLGDKKIINQIANAYKTMKSGQDV